MKKTLKRILSVVLCMIVAAGATGMNVATGAGTLTLDKNAVFIDGYPDKTFLPDKTMTRAEAIKVVSVAAGYTTAFDASGVKTAFTDMAGTEWYAPNVKYLEKYDVLDFYGTKLDAGKGITRGEFVKLIATFVPEKTGTKSFPDVPTSHPYYNEIIKAAKAGIVEGNPDGTFAPDATLTRAEIVTIIDRLVGRHILDDNTKKVSKFSDINGHWAESYIIAASCTPAYNDIVLWYSGNVYASNSPVDKTTLDYSMTQTILEGIDASDGAAAEKAIEAYKDKRIEEIRNTPTTIKPAENRTAYYVSTSGDDANDGLTPETAWKTLNKVANVYLRVGDVVYFKRGDTFRGHLETKNGVIYSAYGEGAKPNFYGSLKDYASGDFWQKTEVENVYVSKESFRSDVGNIVFNNGEAWGYKKAQGINGTDIASDLEFYHNTSDKKIYLYSVSDPNTRFDNVEICSNATIIGGTGSKVTIDNLCIKYTGGSGIGYGGSTYGLTVQNCEIGWTGGSLMRTGRDPVRYGNAVEIHGLCGDYTIDNCYIYQIYDAGVTFQYFKNNNNPSVMKMEDISFRNNVIETCTYAIEYINGQPEDRGIMQNIEFSGNMLVHSGSGWGKQRPDRNGSTTAVIKGWSGTNHSQNFLIYDNVIMTKDSYATLVHMCVDDAKNMPEVTGNIFANIKGQKFGLYGTGNKSRERDMIIYNEQITDKTVGLDDNTFVFLE